MPNLTTVNDAAVFDATRATARPWRQLAVCAASATALLFALAYLYVLIAHLS